jgi:hypothetical protein
MKQAISVRIDPALLARARRCAKQENRTLTNFLETVLKERLSRPAMLNDVAGVGKPVVPGTPSAL